MDMTKDSIRTFPKRKKYSGIWSKIILADYCLSLIRNQLAKLKGKGGLIEFSLTK